MILRDEKFWKEFCLWIFGAKVHSWILLMFPECAVRVSSGPRVPLIWPNLDTRDTDSQDVVSAFRKHAETWILILVLSLTKLVVAAWSQTTFLYPWGRFSHSQPGF